MKVTSTFNFNLNQNLLFSSPLIFDYFKQQITIGDLQLAIYRNSVTDQFIHNNEQTYCIISKSIQDDSIIIPGPQVLKNMVVLTNQFQFLFKRADYSLYLNLINSESIDFDYFLAIDDQIYQVEVFRSNNGVFLLIFCKNSITRSDGLVQCSIKTVEIQNFSQHKITKIDNSHMTYSLINTTNTEDHLLKFDQSISSILTKTNLTTEDLKIAEPAMCSIQPKRINQLDLMNRIIQNELKQKEPNIYKIRSCQKYIKQIK